jgi:hypothetical protein
MPLVSKYVARTGRLWLIVRHRGGSEMKLERSEQVMNSYEESLLTCCVPHPGA